MARRIGSGLVPLGVWVEVETRRALERLAAEDGCTLSETVRAVLDGYVGTCPALCPDCNIYHTPEELFTCCKQEGHPDTHECLNCKRAWAEGGESCLT
jgi:hypothetical protein